MSRNQKQKLVDQSSNSVWFLLWGVAAITFFLKTDFYDPFNSSKLILLLIIDGWLFGHLINSYKENPINIKSKEFTSTIIVVGFIIFLLVSTVTTDIFIVGLMGDTQRRNGFLAYLGLSIIFLYAARRINFENILRVYKVAILTGLVLSAYGLMQISGKDFIKWNNPYSAMITTLGNPNFASATLAILFLIATYGLFLKNLSIIYKVISIIFMCAALIDIIVSGSRQGLLAIFFSLLFYSSIFFYFKNRKIGIIVSIFSSLSSLLAALGMLQMGPLVSLVYKDSVSVRGYYWRAGIEMFKHHPLTGVGVDRYANNFKEFREVGYPLKYGYEITSSNAHNTFIQLFATAGVFVGSIYLILCGYILSRGINLLKKSNLPEQKIILGILSAWIGFQAQSLISIDNIGIAVWGWLLGGVIVGLSHKVNTNANKNFDSRNISSNSRQVKINLFQPMISTLLLIPILIFSSLFYKSETDLYFLSLISVPSAPQNKEKVLEYSNKILKNPFSDPFYKYRAGVLLFNMGYSEESFKIISNLHKFDPKNIDYLQSLAYFEELRKNTTNAINVRNEISKVDPWNADNYLKLLLLYRNSGDLVNATAMKNKILSFAPNTDLANTASETIR